MTAVITATVGRLRRDFVVDDEDAHYRLKRWSLMGKNGRYYAGRREMIDGERRTVYLHRLIAGLPGWGRAEGDADHIDGDTGNCRRSNLRVVSHGRNTFNRQGSQRNSRSGVRGVSRDARTGRYRVRVQANGRTEEGGSFATIAEAERQAKLLRAALISQMGTGR